MYRPGMVPFQKASNPSLFRMFRMQAKTELVVLFPAVLMDTDDDMSIGWFATCILILTTSKGTVATLLTVPAMAPAMAGCPRMTSILVVPLADDDDDDDELGI